jgi:RimJ/RimL family protein N-acetyltransferase
MNLFLKLLFSFVCFISLGISAGYESAEWDLYRLSDAEKTLAPVKTAPAKSKIALTGHSIGDEDRFEKHAKDMWSFFSDDRILATWGGINAKKDTQEQFDGALCRWKSRAQANLLSWRLYYNEADELISMAGSYLPMDTGSQYDGGAEVIYNTHPDFRGRGIAPEVVASYIAADMVRPPFKFAWISADPKNGASHRVAEKLGFSPWPIDQGDPMLPSHMKRPGRVFFKKDRDQMGDFS